MNNKASTFSRVNDPSVRAYDNAEAKNLTGHPAWSTPLEERTIQLLSTGTLDNTFYQTKEELSKEASDVFGAILAKDPVFLAKAIVHARNVGCIRLMPIVGLVFLSTGEQKQLFRDAFRQTIRTPHDLATFVQWCRRAGIRKGLGQGVKRVINVWLNQLGEFHAIKYPLESGSDGFSLRDIIRVSRPVPKSESQKALFSWIVKGEVPSAELLPQVSAYEALKRSTDPSQARELIEKGRIPHEVATGIVKPDQATWGFIMRQMPHFALLRNLNTLTRQGVLGDSENVEYVVGRLTDRKAVLNSRVLPFRYFEALQAYINDGNTNNRIVGALGQALETSFQNMPELVGNVVIGVDTSGSMGSSIGGKSSARYIDVASIFAAALYKKSRSVTVYPFDTRVHNFTYNQGDSILTIAKGISGYGGGGTDIGSFVREVNRNSGKVDTLIGITDSEEWHTEPGGYGGSRGFYGEWLKLKQSNPNACAFLVRIDPYATSPHPPADKSITMISGWSPSVIEFIALAQKGFGAQVEAVRNVSLTESKRTAHKEDT